MILIKFLINNIWVLFQESAKALLICSLSPNKKLEASPANEISAVDIDNLPIQH